MSAWTWIAVAGLGGSGAILRFLLDGAVSARVGGRLPSGTLLVNLSGTFVLGILSGAALSGVAATLVETATIGSYTTFSTWMLESQRLAEDGSGGAAASNLLGSLVLGFAAVAAGRALGRSL
jgi:CrcB protein